MMPPRCIDIDTVRNVTAANGTRAGMLQIEFQDRHHHSRTATARKRVRTRGHERAGGGGRQIAEEHKVEAAKWSKHSEHWQYWGKYQEMAPCCAVLRIATFTVR